VARRKYRQGDVVVDCRLDPIVSAGSVAEGQLRDNEERTRLSDRGPAAGQGCVLLVGTSARSRPLGDADG